MTALDWELDRKASARQNRSWRARGISDHRRSRGCARGRGAGRTGGDSTAARVLISSGSAAWKSQICILGASSEVHNKVNQRRLKKNLIGHTCEHSSYPLT